MGGTAVRSSIEFEISSSHWQLTFLFTTNTESPSMKKITRYIDQLTHRIIPNGPTQTRTRHLDDDQLTLPYTTTATPSSSFPTLPGPSNPTDSRSKGLLISRVLRRIGKKFTNERRCMSFAPLPVTTPTDSMQCRPDRHTPK